MEEQSPRQATGLLQIGATVSAIAIALATLTEERGPTLGELQVVSVGFLIAGLTSLAGSLFAMAQIWRDAGMSLRHLVGEWVDKQQLPDTYGPAALVVITWGLVLLGVV